MMVLYCSLDDQMHYFSVVNIKKYLLAMFIVIFKFSAYLLRKVLTIWPDTTIPSSRLWKIHKAGHKLIPKVYHVKFMLR